MDKQFPLSASSREQDLKLKTTSDEKFGSFGSSRSRSYYNEFHYDLPYMLGFLPEVLLERFHNLKSRAGGHPQCFMKRSFWALILCFGTSPRLKLDCPGLVWSQDHWKSFPLSLPKTTLQSPWRELITPPFGRRHGELLCVYGSCHPHTTSACGRVSAG